MFLLTIKLDRVSVETKGRENLQKTAGFVIKSIVQDGICVNLTPKMRQSLLNVKPRSQMMPNFTFPLHKYDSKKRLNRQQVLLRLAPTLVKVNDLTPLRQEFSNSAPKIFGVEYMDGFHPGL